MVDYSIIETTHQIQPKLTEMRADYRTMLDKRIFSMGFYAGVALTNFVKASGVSADTYTQEGDKMADFLIELKSKIPQFCQRYQNIHSSWIYKNDSQKTLMIYTVLDSLDFETEKEIFQKLYGGISPCIEEYYIDPRVACLEGSDISEAISSEFTQVYLRGKIGA